MISSRALIELILKLEELKEKYNLNYIIYTKVTKDNGERFVQNYNIQRLTQAGELLDMMENYDWEVTITHITSHIGEKEEE
jgi:hypothetical protein